MFSLFIICMFNTVMPCYTICMCNRNHTERLNNLIGSRYIYFHNLYYVCLNVWMPILRDLDWICEGMHPKAGTNKNHRNRARGSTRHRGVMRAPLSKTRFIPRIVDAHLRNDALTCE